MRLAHIDLTMKNLISKYSKMEYSPAKKICLILSVVLALSSRTFAQNSATSGVTVNASVIQGLVLGAVSESLKFGDAQNYIVKGAVAASDTVINVSSDARAVNFSVTADGGQNITVSFPATQALIGSVSGTLTYTPTAQCTSSTSQSGGTAITNGVAFSLGGTLYSSATKYIWIGGSLAGATTAAPGTYTGTITVTVSY